jgi:NAD(P)H-quinone oxidoreductase subunit 4L
VTIGITHFLVVSALLLGIGLFGVFARRNGVAMLMSVQLMFNGANIALVGFARFGYNDSQPLSGMAFALFVVIAAFAETAVAVALLLLVWRRHHHSVESDELVELEA